MIQASPKIFDSRNCCMLVLVASLSPMIGCLTVNLPAIHDAGTPSESNDDESSTWIDPSSDVATEASETGHPTSTTATTNTTPGTTPGTTTTTSISSGDPSTLSSATSEVSDSTSDASHSGSESQATDSSTTATSSSTSETTTTTVPMIQAARITALTKSYAGHYAPHNAGVLWIENQAGQHVDTLVIWAKVRRRHLAAWKIGFGGDLGDAITGATAPEHLEHQVVWDLRDNSGAPVADGIYHLRGEFTEENSDEDDVTDGPTFNYEFRLSRSSAEPFEKLSESGFVRVSMTYE